MIFLKQLKTIYFSILGIILIISGVIFMFMKPLSPYEVIPFLSLFIKPVISQPTTVDIRIFQGQLVKINNNVISVDVPNEGVRHFIISKTFDFHKLVSGSLSKGDGVTTPVRYTDFQLGQELLIIVESKSNYTRSIYVLNSN